jgi:serine-type D-Ala-D-Ala carboxypeptidase/endopeptidase (penicillin-binding protein 4)
MYRKQAILFYFLLLTFSFVFFSCSTQQKITNLANKSVLKDSTLSHALVGISLYDPSTGKYLYSHNSDKFFVPASNIKILSCYLGMKYLGDSLPGIKYSITDKGVVLVPTADPSLLHAEFKRQPVIDFLQKEQRPLFIDNTVWKSEALGSGWSWDDYNDYYMVERSSLPVYGNVIHWIQEREEPAKYDSSQPDVSVSIYSSPEVNWKVRFNPDDNAKKFHVQRQKDENVFTITEGKELKKDQELPFVTHGIQSALELLKDTIGKEIIPTEQPVARDLKFQTIFSQPTDSLLKPMMRRSDNFYAEQVLLMVSGIRLGKLDDGKLIDTVLKSDFKDMPQSPVWADGSGLSRYNLFTPQDFVFVLDKMKTEFGMDRIKSLFSTGGSGTLGTYYKNDSAAIYAKTGTLSGVVCLSGFLYTDKGKLLIFSFLVNNHHGSTTAIRRKVEDFILSIRHSY